MEAGRVEGRGESEKQTDGRSLRLCVIVLLDTENGMGLTVYGACGES
ncbi:hypothetical protein PpBr36_07796 [Pyricularia pennisetigena]|nr:hypothetical protein PpBr36_07796 [Pyricularia pennisetigena]TLS25608.1 hypothetical protein PpBr36_07796 [Pyricularia pennisetigena]